MTRHELDILWSIAMHEAIKAGEDFTRYHFAALLREKMISEGWRQCAQGQRTTQHCAVAEQARQEEREACAQECDAVAESANKAAVAGQYLIIKNGAEARRCAAAIRARSKT